MRSGFLLIDKPSGPTSHDVVAWARRALKNKRVGHCGTLDPLASGLLLLGVGDALKFQDKLTQERKTYRARLRLGLETDTDDITGQTLGTFDPSGVTEAALRSCLAGFLGPQEQQVPRFSAVKVGGRRLYDYARAGETVALPTKRIEIYRLELLTLALPEADFLMDCSKGTYVRALARDVGRRLRVGAVLVSLVREAIGGFSRAQAYAWQGQEAARWLDLEKAFVPLEQLPA